jgi:molybdopterin-guanine dinucleotide biosynthesis protein A
MPFLDPSIIRHLCEIHNEGFDAVIPFSEGGQEPLHAVYSLRCKDIFEDAIQNGERKILDILSRVNSRQVSYAELQNVGCDAASFLNVNTPEEYEGIQSVR